MGRAKNFVFGLIVALAAVSGACASMGGERSISEVKTNPGKFHDKTVTVEGVVTTSFGIASLNGEHAPDLHHAADAALGEAKRARPAPRFVLSGSR